MIVDLTIRGQGSFDKTGVKIETLKEINYFYGANGSGKTTISRVIENHSDLEGCSVSWKSDKPLVAMVYNRDFVDLNFNPASDLKGVFTLGEKDVGILKAIDAAIAEKASLDGKIANLEATRAGKLSQIAVLDEQMKEACWALKIKYESVFRGAFAGQMGTKAAFRDKMILALERKAEGSVDIAALISEAETVFSSKLEVLNSIPFFDSTKISQSQAEEILSKKVVGKEDIDISKIIKKLGNSDWVKQGRDYFEKSDGICPFCQQETEDEFAKQLNEYFDESYSNDLASINGLIEKYEIYSQQIISYIDNLLYSPPKHLNVDELSLIKKSIQAGLSTNKNLLDKKKREASSVVELEDLNPVLIKLTTFIKDVNNSIEEHNKKVENIVVVKRDLTAKVWQALAEELRGKYVIHRSSADGFQKAIESATNDIITKSALSGAKDAEIKKLEGEITSIQPTINAINKLLSSFGFTGFQLAKSEKDGFYKIVRPDGSEAKHTLSEGEKTFVTFLYFFHLLRGSNSVDGISYQRIVVLDDPISSLDSDILFIVSNLIKSLIADVQSGVGHLKQLFILTHNIYFHKEITFSSKRTKNQPFKEETFWVVRKKSNVSTVIPHKDNPIKTSYDLLWTEIRTSDKNSSAIQNVMRRILENYFKIMGGIDIEKLVDGFDGQDKVLCKSLVSWVNDGSHFGGDDLYMNCDEDLIERYMLVFKHIFKISGNGPHYYMMMGILEADDQLANLYEDAA